MVAGTATIAGCRLGDSAAASTSNARITARPGAPPSTSMAPGIHDLVVADRHRHCWLVVPASYEPSRAWPLTLFFRGAITPARDYLDAFQPIADEHGIIILAPEAASRTWDLVLGGFGPDVDFINRALNTAFQTVRVDPARVCSSGFSDGASYSLSLGMTNGDFLTRIAAYSPGFMQSAGQRGHPGFFFTHGINDAVLPVDTSRYIVAELKAAGYSVEYREFDGPHAVKLSLVRECFEWMVRPASG